ncbi:DsbE family thiol:disulfide interchange protein [Endozoicomonas sp. Mp262]|uniref:DsbE family thiol:disulfide interchange protein n=1 Tax=Endozoicomonas sp. Mp262 TaxID=2919499 RepID=UPI0021DAC58D
MKRWQMFLPLIIFLGLCLLLYMGLFRDKQGELPSALLNQPLPAFQLATVEGDDRIITEKDLIGEVALVNVWATWCISCRVEHPFLVKLAERGIPIYGVNYKDETASAKKWLKELHNPYRFSISDPQGKLGIDLGVYGAPETYLIDRKGIIRYKHVGVVDEKLWSNTLKPHYDALLNVEQEDKGQ